MFLVRDAEKKSLSYNLDLACEIEEEEKTFVVTLPTGTVVSVDKESAAGMFVGGFVMAKLQGKARRID
jgi:hypothetical protein